MNQLRTNLMAAIMIVLALPPSDLHAEIKPSAPADADERPKLQAYCLRSHVRTELRYGT